MASDALCMHGMHGCFQVTVYEEGDERTYDMAGAFCKYLPTGSWSHRCVHASAPSCARVRLSASLCPWLHAGVWMIGIDLT